MKKRILAALAGLSAGLLFCGCDSPESAFDEWKDAILDGKIDKANARTVETSHVLNGIIVQSLKRDDKARGDFRQLSVVDEKTDGNRAVLKIKDAAGHVTDFDMIKEDGRWKVAPRK
ncbi:MAG: DUF4878 domain-containing protein [Lentisphaeria bacterium]|nr:DUF4878 domain-containing protein [Lentisphaeria bacterium]